ncbi:metallo-beta-lactamase superfamily protein [Metarhizium album ARSEF 1941]|uniref:Metallo-beta-lactamase superfamily protein n=1 Tax=Metarhizium album (strain ARSEF 1941) TaxID=1081103 RepID=A0A0B2WVH7_METAS|nr:metallo-beta-lactamase superfamily protein [Metarhizium album ARSEF 1941]KHN97629.1 metallo-beta-lactamase superfamily protein [Metarhizium album ARSEF 1941]
MATRIPFDESVWQEYLAGQESQLPPLRDVQHVTDRVVRIMGGNPGMMQLQGTNTYLVGTGRSRILIDTGEGLPCWIERVVRVLQDARLDLAFILLTHWHGDHTGGVPDLVAYDANLADRIYKHQPDRGQHPIADGQMFSVDGATIRAVFTPGHAIDHMCFVLEEENALFTGDNVLGHGFSVVMDLAVYMRSLDRMAAQNCASGYPAHGADIVDLPARIHQYVHHNEFRIQQVVSALSWHCAKGAKGGMTLQEIVQSIYGNVPKEIVDNALVPFLSQVLWKLAEDRKVGFCPGEPKKRRWFGLAAAH